MHGMMIAVVAAGFVIGAILMALRPRRDRGARDPAWVKYVVYVLVVALVLAAARLGSRWLQGLVAAIAVLGAIELRRALPARGYVILRLSVWAGCLAIVALAETVLQHLAPQRAAYLYIIVAVFDGFSQVSGQLLGSRRLVPKLSPGKTVVGLLGGATAALIVATLLRELADLNGGQALIRGAVVCAVALAGDLAASWLKRRAGIKDYGRMLPGHGGILDRFDSVLPVLALCGPLYL
jgi:phosphatidate cytidylyltransferase